MSPVDRARIEAAVSEILAAIGEDPGRPGLAGTPRSVAEAYAEFFAGVGRDARAHLSDQVAAGEAAGELILLRDLDLRSVCEHHLLPFLGTAHIAYVPRERIVGLGRLARVLDTVAARPQLQERLTEEVAEAISEGLDALGVLVVVDAVHGCVTARAGRQSRSSTVTVAARGVLAEPARRAEAIALIGGTTVSAAAHGADSTE